MSHAVSVGYRTDPVHVLPELELGRGYDHLAGLIERGLRRSGLVVLDGFTGLPWETFIQSLRAALEQHGIGATWLSTADCFLAPDAVEGRLAPFLTDDPVFGRIYHGTLQDLWNADRAKQLRDCVESATDPVILWGTGASLLSSSGFRVYVDVPKDVGQVRAARGEVWNIGADRSQPFAAMYKRMYFVEWPMLNRLKRAMLPSLDVVVDGSDLDAPIFAKGASFRSALDRLSRRPFRVKPWFAPGPWGGQWMKDRFGLPPEQPNYAWSFELIAPENGLLLGDGERILECSFDYLLWQQTDAVLGTAVAARYGSYFPIRFDYLDTMGGTNLSYQVHPRLDYVRDEFGEPFTQDETYYIVTCEEGARVFLGLRDEAELESFRRDAARARDDGVPFDIARHVNSLPSTPHDLFLIPSGTVHCSGANNLVLEISATPYIYTFKIYDYLRSDLRGNLRPVHLDHAFNNIDPARRAGWVRHHLCPKPRLLRHGDGWAEYVIGDIDLLFFAIHRLECRREIHDQTNGRFLALNLVEGERCEIVTEGNEPVELRFAESIVIPASVGAFSIRNLGDADLKIVKAFVK